jgi:hypothetical protein
VERPRSGDTARFAWGLSRSILAATRERATYISGRRLAALVATPAGLREEPFENFLVVARRDIFTSRGVLSEERCSSRRRWMCTGTSRRDVSAESGNIDGTAGPGGITWIAIRFDGAGRLFTLAPGRMRRSTDLQSPEVAIPHSHVFRGAYRRPEAGKRIVGPSNDRPVDPFKEQSTNRITRERVACLFSLVPGADMLPNPRSSFAFSLFTEFNGLASVVNESRPQGVGAPQE